MLKAGWATEFDFSFEKMSETKNEFLVDIISSDDSVQDVKIYIHNSTKTSIGRRDISSSMYYESSWVDSWNYLLSAYPKNNRFKIKMTKELSNAKICVKLRKSRYNSISQTCRELESQYLENQITKIGQKEKKSIFFSSELSNIMNIMLFSYIGLIIILLFYFLLQRTA